MHARHGAYGQRKEAKALAIEDANELRQEGFLARVTFERQDYGIWAVVWKGPQVGPATKVEITPDPVYPQTHRVVKIKRKGGIMAATYAEPFPTPMDALRDFRQTPRDFRPYNESTGMYVEKWQRRPARPRLTR
jgi:hypothetical protein